MMATRRQRNNGGVNVIPALKKSIRIVKPVHSDAQPMEMRVKRTKRQADCSPNKEPRKRAAFGDLTNAIQDSNVPVKVGLKKTAVKQTKNTKSGATNPNLQPKVHIEQKTVKNIKTHKVPSKSQETLSQSIVHSSQSSHSSSQSSVASSQASEVSSQSTYYSSQTTCSQSSTKSQQQSNDENALNSSNNSKSSDDDSSTDTAPETDELTQVQLKVRPSSSQSSTTSESSVVDIDAANAGDTFQCPDYAYDIFQYYKDRESQFVIDDYLERQTSLTAAMRAILVDWLVEVQENFELNHETLYLAVKLTDMYLMKKNIKRENLQLVGAASLFISCKFDERCPPLVDDFLFICDDAYHREQFLATEQLILKSIGFDLGIPLSYRFLRRYAKCDKASMETLTLGRYVLEMSLMHYQFTRCRDSLLASAALYLALKMNKTGEWTPTLVHYTGYNTSELMPVVRQLNDMLCSPIKPNNLMTVRTKYSHKVFFEVAKIPALDVIELSL